MLDNAMLKDIASKSGDARSTEERLLRIAEGLAICTAVILTDKLKSYGVAKREVLPDVERRQS